MLDVLFPAVGNYSSSSVTAKCGSHTNQLCNGNCSNQMAHVTEFRSVTNVHMGVLQRKFS